MRYFLAAALAAGITLLVTSTLAHGKLDQANIVRDSLRIVEDRLIGEKAALVAIGVSQDSLILAQADRDSVHEESISSLTRSNDRLQSRLSLQAQAARVVGDSLGQEIIETVTDPVEKVAVAALVAQSRQAKEDLVVSYEARLTNFQLVTDSVITLEEATRAAFNEFIRLEEDEDEAQRTVVTNLQRALDLSNRESTLLREAQGQGLLSKIAWRGGAAVIGYLVRGNKS